MVTEISQSSIFWGNKILPFCILYAILGEGSNTSSKKFLLCEFSQNCRRFYFSPFYFLFHVAIEDKWQSTNTKKPNKQKVNNQIQQNQKQIPRLKLSHVLFVNIFRLFQGVSPQQVNFKTFVFPSLKKKGRIQFSMFALHMCLPCAAGWLYHCQLLPHWEVCDPQRRLWLTCESDPNQMGFTVTQKLAD